MDTKISLRKFPYPYKAALTVCSDIDETGFEPFLHIHHFLNSTEGTLLGPGLGLPIGDSFWMYDEPDAPESAFAYFNGLTHEPSKYAPLMRDFMAAGILDVLHTYGNFKSPDAFCRILAQQALEELDRYHLKIRTWTNHGDNFNRQKIGGLSGGLGDVPSDLYHADLLKTYGMRFFWEQEAQVTSVVGQDRSFHFAEAYWQSPLFSGIRLKGKYALKGFLSQLDRLNFKLSKTHFLPGEPFSSDNALLNPVVLRDGNRLLKFRRFGNGRLDWSDHLPVLLSEQVVQALIEKEGYLIAYIHLGSRIFPSNNLPFSPESVQAFQRIARYSKDSLWVHTTTRILTYNYVRNNLQWTVEETDSHYLIRVLGVSSLDSAELTADDFAGLTFCAPADKPVKLIFQNQSLPVQVQKTENFQFILIPVPPVQWPLTQSEFRRIMKEF